MNTEAVPAFSAVVVLYNSNKAQNTPSPHIEIDPPKKDQSPSAPHSYSPPKDTLLLDDTTVHAVRTVAHTSHAAPACYTTPDSVDTEAKSVLPTQTHRLLP
mmetsp:Transcript_23693/g.35340  ORF Transcript_23693/g.35340 Transcript_23693/m.35340 type:complete len:101 (-) Transcript_23693:610-912(-)